MSGCPAVAYSAGRMREHFMYRHFFSRIEVVQEERDTLPRCDLCGMHIPVGRLLKYQRTKRCNRNMKIWWRRKDVVIASRCEGETFSLTGEDGVECIEGVDTFKYLGSILDRSDDNWTAVRRNVRKDRRFWNRLGELLRR